MAQQTEQGEPHRNARDARYRRDLTLIEGAKPQPYVKPVSGQELEHVETVKGASGATYYLTDRKVERTATAPTRGCDHGRPQPPGVTARHTRPRRVVVTYRIGEGDDNCRAKWIQVLADVSNDTDPGDSSSYPIAKHRSGQIILSLDDDLANADILVAATQTRKYSGLASRSTTVRIR